MPKCHSVGNHMSRLNYVVNPLNSDELSHKHIDPLSMELSILYSKVKISIK